MAFLFGSIVKGTATSESDADLAVYFWPEGDQLEWEEDKFYKNEDEIWSGAEKIIGLRTDLLILNRAPSSVASSAIQEGMPLVIKDRALYLRFLLTISSAAEEFRDFVRDFWEIKERSRSLSKIDEERLLRAIDFLKNELEDFPEFQDLDQKTYERDSAKRRNVERWVENIVNASIDIAKILLASNKKRIPLTYREILGNLGYLKGFDSKTAAGLSDFAKLRNLLAHEYLDIRYKNIQRFIKTAEPLYKKLAKFTKQVIENKILK